MEPFWYIWIFLLGTIIGSFLNVVIYRLHTGKSLNGRSHCLSCGKILKWYELLPVISYLTLRARCGECSSHIPIRYFLVEFTTGLSFLFLWHLFQTEIILFTLYGILAGILIVTAVYDLRHTIIPDEMVLAIGFIAMLFLVHGFIFEGIGWGGILFSILGGLAAALFFAGLWLVSKGRWIGLGDAKLALPLGVIAGPSAVFSMVVLSFWVGALISLALMLIFYLLKKGKTHIRYFPQTITMKSEIPFAPFLIAGFLLVELFHADIFEITLWFFPFYW